MTTAVVTITCPSCGGRADNIQTTAEEQTIKCAFCGTELHIPRIGEVVHERVVREVVHEVVHDVASSPAPDYEDVIRTKASPAKVAAIGAISLAVVLGLVYVVKHEADDDLANFDRAEADQKAAQDGCAASCKQECAHAGDKERGQWDTTGMEPQIRDTDIMVCKSECETRDCSGIKMHAH
ncbi:MAG: hypothetical protein ABI467_30010 [Kofleriaceae bacterium]